MVIKILDDSVGIKAKDDDEEEAKRETPISTDDDDKMELDERRERARELKILSESYHIMILSYPH